jgi:hypothetical protein
MRNQLDVGNSELLDEVTTTDDGAGKMKHAFAVPDTNSSVVVQGSRNNRHVYLHIKPVGAPVFHEVGLAAGCNLNSCDPFSCVLSTGVEGATCIVSLVKLTIVELDDIWHDYQLEESGKNISAEIACKSLHDQEEFGDFQE